MTESKTELPLADRLAAGIVKRFRELNRAGEEVFTESEIPELETLKDAVRIARMSISEKDIEQAAHFGLLGLACEELNDEDGPEDS